MWDGHSFHWMRPLLAFAMPSWLACGNSVANMPLCAYDSCPYVTSSAQQPQIAVPTQTTATPLTGCLWSYYLVQATVGAANPTNVSLEVDTGSSTFGVATAGCSNCGLAFDYQPSPNALSSNGLWSEVGGDSTEDGYFGLLYDDTLKVGSNAPVNIEFVGMTSTFNNFLKPYDCGSHRLQMSRDGILGMAADTGGLDWAQPYLDQLPVDQTIFSVQLCDFGGQMWFGGYDPSFAEGPPTFVPNVSTSGSWFVQLQAIQMADGPSIPVNAPMLVDTGTWGLVLPLDTFNALDALLRQSPAIQSWQWTPSNLFTSDYWFPFANQTELAQLAAYFPPIAFVLQGPPDAHGNPTTVTLTVPATSSYMAVFYNNGFDASAGGSLGFAVASGDQILGGSVLKNFITVFDKIDNSIGFAAQRGATSCPSKLLRARKLRQGNRRRLLVRPHAKPVGCVSCFVSRIRNRSCTPVRPTRGKGGCRRPPSVANRSSDVVDYRIVAGSTRDHTSAGKTKGALVPFPRVRLHDDHALRRGDCHCDAGAGGSWLRRRCV